MNCPHCDGDSNVKQTYPRYEMHEDKSIPVKRRKRKCQECKRVFYTVEMLSGTARRLAALGEDAGLTRTPLASKKK